MPRLKGVREDWAKSKQNPRFFARYYNLATCCLSLLFKMNFEKNPIHSPIWLNLMSFLRSGPGSTKRTSRNSGLGQSTSRARRKHCQYRPKRRKMQRQRQQARQNLPKPSQPQQSTEGTPVHEQRGGEETSAASGLRAAKSRRCPGLRANFR